MIIYVNDKGKKIAEVLSKELTMHVGTIDDMRNRWDDLRSIVFVGALGICVRSIAPYIKDKHTDPAVVCVDSLGKQVIAVLSGHVGGANTLTKNVADILGATPVITTQSDLQGLWALDTLARQYGWSMVEEHINDEIALFVAEEPTALLLDVSDKGTEYLLNTLPKHVTLVDNADEITRDKYRLAIIVSPMEYILSMDIAVVQYVPRCVNVGIGLAHQAQPADGILNNMMSTLTMTGLHPDAIREFRTIDLKADEPVVKLINELGDEVRFFTSDELSTVDVPNPSETVAKHVGTPSVSEASALFGGGTILIPKQKGENWTCAAAIDNSFAKASDNEGNHSDNPSHGHIEIVGAGPGDPDLVSVRGRRFLENADLILYAGSLVPRELTECHKPGCVVRSSASMALEEQFALMKQFYDEGKLVVRLHTGDPCIYGAIQEQMNYFDQFGMSYHITPGISSFLAAAAELRSQFTIPEKCQTIILTRGEGRTPMPDREKLHMLAEHQSTMCIFLSASIVEQVQSELLQHYPADTPVAACYKLTWKDQRIYRGKLSELTDIIHDNNLTLTTMIVVGEAIDNRQGLSKLYDRHFEHMFRGAKEK